ncbi:MAG: hypothetical protein OEN50_05995 [Deltaproteobacteria bacterium]|nr:hypothetical protein [Deltaproteobacteria bacterium]
MGELRLLNVAVQVMFPLTVIVLLQPVPVQPANVDPLAGYVVSVTCVPFTTLSLQSLPQLIPGAAMCPAPVPVFCTVSK